MTLRDAVSPKAASPRRTLLVLALALFALPAPGTAAPPPGRDVVVEVADAKGGALAGAKLLGVLKTWRDGRFRQEAIAGETGQDGVHAFADLAPAAGRFAVHVAAFAPGRAFRDAYALTEKAPADRIRIALEPSDPVEVRFHSKDGEPVPGVLARPVSRRTPEGEEHVVYSVAADPLVVKAGADGSLELDGFARGDTATIACRFPGAAWTERTFRVGEGPLVVLPDEPEREPEDVAGVPAEELVAGGDGKMRYFLVGPTGNGKKPPPKGFRLLLVLPGGDGSASFLPFVKRIALHSLDETWLVAQLVAVRWNPDQRIVWPKDGDDVEGAEFTTEEFIEAVVKDVAKRRKVDPEHVPILGWSSSGPALYSAMLRRRTPLTGAVIAMSVFKPDDLPPLRRARGRSFVLLHSPEDRVCPYRMAVAAKEELTAAGAEVTLTTYPGGHGWRAGVFPLLRQSLDL